MFRESLKSPRPHGKLDEKYVILPRLHRSAPEEPHHLHALPDKKLQPMFWNEQTQLLVQILLAMGLGGLIGLEREAAGKPAGLRTNILTAGASALFVGLSAAMVEQFALESDLSGDVLRTDPIRVFEAVVTGLSFLGAGTILRQRDDQIEGLTSAATILLSGGIGIAAALGQYLLAITVTFAALLVLQGLGRLETWVKKRRGLSNGEESSKE